VDNVHEVSSFTLTTFERLIEQIQRDRIAAHNAHDERDIRAQTGQRRRGNKRHEAVVALERDAVLGEVHERGAYRDHRDHQHDQSSVHPPATVPEALHVCHHAQSLLPLVLA
jgi:hypothetical protein